MKRTAAIICVIAAVLVSHACGKPATADREESAMTNITLTVGEAVFSAELYDNDTTKAFISQLPMTLNMSDLNSNEKYFYMKKKLPTASEKISHIRAGDLMLYGSDCLVLFYEGFSTPYSYTRLGYIKDSTGFADALGSGDVEVSFSMGK